MEIHIPTFEKIKKTGTYLPRPESNRKFMRDTMVWDEETNAWKVIADDGSNVFIKCLIVYGGDLAS